MALLNSTRSLLIYPRTYIDVIFKLICRHLKVWKVHFLLKGFSRTSQKYRFSYLPASCYLTLKRHSHVKCPFLTANLIGKVEFCFWGFLTLPQVGHTAQDFWPMYGPHWLPGLWCSKCFQGISDKAGQKKKKKPLACLFFLTLITGDNHLGSTGSLSI